MAELTHYTSIIATDEKCKETFCKFYPGLCLFAHRIVKNFDEAEDIVQNTFIALWNKNVELTKKTSLKSYLYSSVYNACINHVKKQAYVGEKMKEFHQEEYDDKNYLLQRIENEVIEEIFHTIERLPEECKKVFKLSYIEGLEVNRVAEILDISENTVKTQRLRARKFLKENLKDLFPLLLLFIPNL